jgi:N-acetylglucosaminyl-diphospho-decaprenol L-rhamnosyltransferase
VLTSAGGSPQPTPLGHVDVVAVVVTYNSAEHIGRLLDALPAAAGSRSLRCLVVDNGSLDGTADIVRARGDARLIAAGVNLGYAGGFNLGRGNAGPCDALLLLNPDLILDGDTVAQLFAALQEPEVGVCVPMLLNGDGTVYHTLRREPSVTRALGDALFGARLSGRPAWLSETVRSPAAYERPGDVDWAGGAAMLISAECDRAVGRWDDERFFLYSEETDFAARARRAGYRVRFVPAARIRHEDGGSGRSPDLAALLAVNRVRYFEKYHGRARARLFRAVVVLQHLLRARDPDSRATLSTIIWRHRWPQLPGGRSTAR